MLRSLHALLSLAVVVGSLAGGACDGDTPDVPEPQPKVINPEDIDDDGVANALDEDIDGDGTPNIQDDDIDGDSVPNADDESSYGDATVQTGAQGDLDGDGVPNNLDNDDNGDSVPDGVSGRNDCDSDGVPEPEEADCDGFCLGVESGYFPCNDGGEPGTGIPDSDGDGTPDPSDLDDDGDGIPDLDDDNGGGLTPIPPLVPNPPNPGECVNTQFTAGEDVLDPRVLLVLDKSGSMDLEDSSGQRKWDAARAAISGVVLRLNDAIEFGLMLYPDGNAQNDQCQEGALRQNVEANNATAIVATLALTSPGGGTPTAVTLAEAKIALDSLPAAGGGRAIILATDGGPNCNESLNGDTCRCVSSNPGDCVDNGANCLDDANSISAAAALNAAGYPVFVVGINGTEAFTDVLNSLASAGGTAQSGATSFYGVDDQAQLESALEDIAVRIGVCRFDLPVNFSASQTTVTVNGGTVTRDTGRINGWDQVDPNTIELFGVPCNDAVNGGSGATVVDVEVCPG